VSLGQLRLKLTLVMVGLFLALSLQAGEPVVPKASKKATQEYGCVAPVADMRKNHMKYILHQRNKTVHQGIRTKKNSLAECVNCHISAKPDGTYARFGDNKHFCSSCHNYVAVTIDCFECHRDTPQQKNRQHGLADKPNPHLGDVSFRQDSTPKMLTSGGAE